MSRAWNGGSTTRWRTIRAAVLRRDHNTCTIRDAGCTTAATHVDHIVPRAMGGTDDMGNLRASCAHCNLTRAKAHATIEPAPKRISTW